MRETKVTEELIFKEIVVSLKCDFCNQEYKNNTNDNIEIKDITHFTIEPGYGSRFDTDIFSFDICDKCLKNLINNKKFN